MQRITPFLWFDSNAEDAAKLYTSIFPNSRIVSTARYSDAGPGPKGSVMTVQFELSGLPFTALNAGPQFKFNEAIAMQVNCANQQEIDYYWEKLGAGGDPKAQQCGWLKDKYGLSWQVVPDNMDAIFGGGDAAGRERAMKVMLQMKKIDIAAMERARDGAA